MSYVMWILNITVSWDVTPYSVVDNWWPLGRSLCHPLQRWAADLQKLT